MVSPTTQAPATVLFVAAAAAAAAIRAPVVPKYLDEISLNLVRKRPDWPRRLPTDVRECTFTMLPPTEFFLAARISKSWEKMVRSSLDPWEYWFEIFNHGRILEETEKTDSGTQKIKKKIESLAKEEIESTDPKKKLKAAQERRKVVRLRVRTIMAALRQRLEDHLKNVSAGRQFVECYQGCKNKQYVALRVEKACASYLILSRVGFLGLSIENLPTKVLQFGFYHVLKELFTRQQYDRAVDLFADSFKLLQGFSFKTAYLIVKALKIGDDSSKIEEVIVRMIKALWIKHENDLFKIQLLENIIFLASLGNYTFARMNLIMKTCGTDMFSETVKVPAFLERMLLQNVLDARRRVREYYIYYLCRKVVAIQGETGKDLQSMKKALLQELERFVNQIVDPREQLNGFLMLWIVYNSCPECMGEGERIKKEIFEKFEKFDGIDFSDLTFDKINTGANTEQRLAMHIKL